MVVDGVPGVRFAVWAPNARRVSVVGDFNSWDGRRHPMRLRHGAGVWELFIPRVAPGALYKYELLGPDGALLPQKADPVAWRVEPPPATASVVDDPAPFRWSDDRSEEHTSELQSRENLVCRLLREKKKTKRDRPTTSAKKTTTQTRQVN